MQRYSIENGLPDTTIYVLQRDNNGYLWLATPSGLSRYDGHKFLNFNAQHDSDFNLVSQNTGALLIDSQERIWVGTWGDGLFLYDKNLKLITHFNEQAATPHRLASNLVQTLFEDNDGDVWIGTNGGGLAVYQNQTSQLRRFSTDSHANNKISHNRIWAISEGESGQIWVGTGDGLNLITKQSDYNVSTFNKNDDLNSSSDSKVRALLFDSNGGLWLGSQTGLLKFNPTTKMSMAVASSANGSPVTSLVQGKGSDIWIGTQRGLYKYNFLEQINGAEQFDKSPATYLPNDDVRNLLYDESGILWAAARPSGLVRLTFPRESIEKYDSYIDEEGKLKALGRAQTVLADRQNKVWIGSNNGLYILDTLSNEIVKPATMSYEAIGLITTSIQRADDSIWFAGSKGLFEYKQDSGEMLAKKELLPKEVDAIINTLYEDSNHRLWIGTANNGLWYVQGQRAIPLDLPGSDIIENKSVNTIAEFAPNQYLASMSGQGMVRFSLNSDSFEQYQTSTSTNAISSNEVTHIFPSTEDKVWLATNNSLNKFNPKSESFNILDGDTGLSNQIIKAIIKDQNDSLWLSTAMGLYHFDQKRQLFTQYTDKHGLHGNTFISRAVSKAPNGDLYFGGTSGMSRIKVSSLAFSQQPPKIVLTAVVVDERNQPQLEFSGLSNVEFNPGLKDIYFHFSEMDFLGLDNVRFSHRLVGHNQNWSKLHSNLQVPYSGLGSGQYRFEVKSFVNGVWSTELATYSFYILPPWWKTWWAISLFSIIAVLLLYLFNQWRIRNLKEQNEVLEQQVAIRSKELVMAQKQLIESEKNSALSSLVTGVAHELNTPVGISVTASSLLLEQSQALQNDFKNNKITRSDFEKRIVSIANSSKLVFKNLQRAAGLVSRFKGVSVDQIPLQKKNIQLRKYLIDLLEELKPELNSKRIDYTIDCPREYKINSYPGALGQLITQLTLNAIDHGFDQQEDGKITIQVRQSQSTTHIHFEDNGTGIPDSIQTRIFEPFFTTKRNTGANGLGLQIAANIVTIRLGGEIKCHSKEGEFTRFDIHFPSDPV